jgi:hypothetical protein
MPIPRFLTPYSLLVVALVIFGFLGCGFAGIVLAFWTLLFWYAVWQRPCRFEMLLLSIIGIVGGLFILPKDEITFLQGVWLLAMALAALAPLIDFYSPIFRTTRSSSAAVARETQQI